ncbi:MAG: 3-methyl-2-oxobutanoate hydroxymethyltransferase [Actinomycetota bacterium]
MTRILDHGGRTVDRVATVASIRGLRAAGRRFAQVTAGTAEEAAAAEEAGIEMLVCMAQAVPALREGSERCFVTAAIDFGGEVTLDDLLGTALTALSEGADAVITARRTEAIELLAKEDIPVMAHLGFVPKKSSLLGGVRSVGKTATEAVALWDRFREVEDAGAFAVECELIPANVMTEIRRRTSMATISLGSGPEADVVFLFTSDICGESEHRPRHARQYADLAALHRRIAEERVRALTEFRSDVAGGAFPEDAELVVAPDTEVDELRRLLDERR